MYRFKTQTISISIYIITYLVWRIRFSLLFLYNCYKIVFIYFCFFVFMYTRRRRAIKILSLKCTNVTGRARLLCGKRVITLYHTSTCTIGLPTVYVACAWRAGRSLVFFFDRFMEIEWPVVWNVFFFRFFIFFSLSGRDNFLCTIKAWHVST